MLSYDSLVACWAVVMSAFKRLVSIFWGCRLFARYASYQGRRSRRRRNLIGKKGCTVWTSNKQPNKKKQHWAVHSIIIEPECRFMPSLWLLHCCGLSLGISAMNRFASLSPHKHTHTHSLSHFHFLFAFASLKPYSSIHQSFLLHSCSNKQKVFKLVMRRKKRILWKTKQN